MSNINAQNITSQNITVTNLNVSYINGAPYNSSASNLCGPCNTGFYMPCEACDYQGPDVCECGEPCDYVQPDPDECDCFVPCNNGGGGIAGPTGATGPTGPTGIQGPEGQAGGLILYLNEANPSGTIGFQSLSPLVDINPNTYTAVLGTSSSVYLDFLFNNPVQNVSTIQNGPVTFYFYGSATNLDAYVQLTGFISDPTGGSQVNIFDISANIPSGGATSLVTIIGTIAGGPYNLIPGFNKIGCRLRLDNRNAVLGNTIVATFQTQGAYTCIITTIPLQGPTGVTGPTGPTGMADKFSTQTTIVPIFSSGSVVPGGTITTNVGTELAYIIGNSVVVTSANPNDPFNTRFEGTISAYDRTTGNMTITGITNILNGVAWNNGSITLANVNLDGIDGPTGQTGPTGALGT